MSEPKTHDHDAPQVKAVKAKAEPPVDFAQLFHVASDEKLPWPKAVLTWAEKHEANQHVLDQIRSLSHSNPAGVASPLVQTLLNEVLKAVKS